MDSITPITRWALVVETGVVETQLTTQLRAAVPGLNWRSLSEAGLLRAGQRALPVSLEEYADAIRRALPRPACIVVGGHVRLAASGRRAPGQGFDLVRWLRMDPDFDVPIVLLSWYSPAQLGRHAEFRRLASALLEMTVTADGPAREACRARHSVLRRLPASPEELSATFGGLIDSAPQLLRPTLLPLARDLIEEQMERECHAVRHRHQGVLAALRLLLGAFAAGDVDEADLTTTMAKFDGAGRRPAEKEVRRMGDLRARWVAVESELARTRSNAPAPAEPRRGSILIVDDHLRPVEAATAGSGSGDSGWLSVYETVFGNSRAFRCELEFAASFDEGMQRCDRRALSAFDLAVLDVDLGDPARSGLHLLREFRGRHPFLPILVMTSFDDAAVCQTALEWQADAFFVKQLRDRSDRGSLDYYRKFVETIESIWSRQNEDREMFETFAELIPAIRTQDQQARRDGQIARLEDGVLGELAKFFLLLRVRTQHHLFPSLATNSPSKPGSESYDELMVSLLDGILASLQWNRGRLQTVEQFGLWLDENENDCFLYLDDRFVIGEEDWDPRAEEYFGLLRQQLAGLPLALLFSDPGECPAPDNFTGYDRFCANLAAAEDVTRAARITLSVRRVRGNSIRRAAISNPHRVITPWEEFVRQHVKGWDGVRHGKIRPVTLEDVRRLARRFLTLLRGRAAEKSDLPEVLGYVSDAAAPMSGPDLRQIVRDARAREQTSVRDHSTRSRMGSEAVLLGLYLANTSTISDDALELYRDFGADLAAEEVIAALEDCCEKASLSIPVKTSFSTSPLSIALVDDHGAENGWAYACQLTHNDARVDYFRFAGAAPQQPLEEYVGDLFGSALPVADLLFLDLLMPARVGEPGALATGLQVATRVRQQEPLLPVVLLSAHGEARAIRAALFAGATEFFPKEVPGGVRADALVEYARRFAAVPGDLGLLDSDWRAFLLTCRAALHGLEKQAAGTAGAPSAGGSTGLALLIPTGAVHTKLATHLGLPQAASVDALRRQFAGHLLWLLRRALFFTLFYQERYLHRWLEHFTVAIPGLRPQMLGYDQVWLNCAMIIEFVFNVVEVASGYGSKFRMPREREWEGRQTIIAAIGPEANQMGLQLWDLRNARRHDSQRNPKAEARGAREIVRSCLRFLSAVELLPDLESDSEVSSRSFVERLQANLALSRERVRISAELRRIDEKIASLSRDGGRISPARAVTVFQQMEALQGQRRELETKHRTLSPDGVLAARHTLCRHLMPQ